MRFAIGPQASITLVDRNNSEIIAVIKTTANFHYFKDITIFKRQYNGSVLWTLLYRLYEVACLFYDGVIHIVVMHVTHFMLWSSLAMRTFAFVWRPLLHICGVLWSTFISPGYLFWWPFWLLVLGWCTGFQLSILAYYSVLLVDLLTNLFAL